MVFDQYSLISKVTPFSLPMPAVPVISCVPADMELGFSKPQFPSWTDTLIPASPTSQDYREDEMRQSVSQQTMSQGPDKHFF